jgi:hypothetical protein
MFSWSCKTSRMLCRAQQRYILTWRKFFKHESMCCAHWIMITYINLFRFSSVQVSPQNCFTTYSQFMKYKLPRPWILQLDRLKCDKIKSVKILLTFERTCPLFRSIYPKTDAENSSEYMPDYYQDTWCYTSWINYLHLKLISLLLLQCDRRSFTHVRRQNYFIFYL